MNRLSWFLVVLLASNATAQEGGAVRQDATRTSVIELTDQLKAAIQLDPGRGTLESVSEADLKTLAADRRIEMAKLMRSAPELAIELSLPAEPRLQLPESVKGRVEERWNGFAELEVIADLGEPAAFLVLPDGRRFKLHRFGRRADLTSKKSLPVSAVLLDDEAVIVDSPMQMLPEEQTRFLEDAGQVRALQRGMDAQSGNRISGAPIRALVGNRIVEFETTDNARAFEDRLRQEEEKIDPNASGRRLLDQLPAAPSSEQSAPNPDQASPWTETAKEVLVLRVVFPDRPDEPVPHEELKAAMDGSVDSFFQENSYGRTQINAFTFPTLISVAGDSASYRFNYFGLHSQAVAAYTALGTGPPVGDFDIVGIYFAGVGYSWAGLATLGGTRFWVELPYVSPRVIVHELGHNYGLEHASAWISNNGSAVGSGYGSEYGNIFDVMGSGPVPDGHFTVYGKSRLNWIENEKVILVDSGNATYRLHENDRQSSDEENALGFRVSDCQGGYYWAGLRSRFEVNPTLNRGIALEWRRQLGSPKTYLLDMTPGTSTRFDSALLEGRTFSDPDGCSHITAVRRGGTSEDPWIDVHVATQANGNAAPQASIKVLETVRSRTLTQLRADVEDLDDEEFAYFWDLGANVPSVNQREIVQSWDQPGSVSVSVEVSDLRGGVALAPKTIEVVDPLADPWEALDRFTDEHLWADTQTHGDTMVVVGGSNWAARSNNGRTFQLGSVPGEFVHFQHVNRLGNLWVARGLVWDWNLQRFDEGFLSSEDGLTWTVRHRFNNGAVMSDMDCSPTVCVAVGSNDYLVRSEDGLNWQEIDLAAQLALSAITYGDGEFVISGYRSGVGPSRLKTTDGLSWSLGNARCDYSMLEYLNGTYFGACGFSLDWSDDTVTWNRLVPGLYVDAMTFGGGLYIATGWDGQRYIRSVAVDGRSWSRLGARQQARENALAYFADRFTAVGDASSIYGSPVTEVDSDRDGMPDRYEIALGFNPFSADDAWTDVDGDRLIAQQEYWLGTSPVLTDTDGDGLSDGIEYLDLQTSPRDRDTDNDGLGDGVEVDLGRDPLVATVCPQELCSPTESSSVLRLIRILKSVESESG